MILPGQRSWTTRRRQFQRRYASQPLFELLEDRRLLSATITVNSTADTDLRDGVLTLREAILVNNGDLALASLSAQEQGQISGSPTSGTNTIDFNIPATDPRHFFYADDGVAGQVTPDDITSTVATDDSAIAGIDPDWAHSWFSIMPTTTLPDITHTVTIDGYSQSGSAVNTVPAGTNSATGLNTVLKIELDGEQVSADGLKLTFGGIIGVNFGDAGGSTVRGLAIGSFGGNGITVDTNGGNNTIAGNFIGSDVSGLLNYANSGDGVLLRIEVSSNIGGPAPADRNLIGGNAHQIEILGGSAHSIIGNLINVNRIQTATFAPTGSQVLISNNESQALQAASAPTSESSALAAKALPANAEDDTNAAAAAYKFQLNEYGDPIFNGLVEGSIIAVEDPTPGSTLPARATWVLDNLTNIFGGVPQPVQRSQNAGAQAAPQAAVTPSFLAIDLGADGITPNDPKDADTGANDLQNFPVVSSATTAGGTTAIAGTLNSNPNSDFRVEFYSESVGTNFRAGEQFLGFTNVHTDAKGNAAFTFNSPIAVPAGQFITTTATRLVAGTLAPIETSEFSAPLAVTEKVGAVFNNGVLTVDGTDGADAITVQPTTDAQHVQVLAAGKAIPISTGATTSTSIRLTSVNTINVNGHDGDDTLTVSKLNKVVNIDGGDGTDKLIVNGSAAANGFSLGSTGIAVNNFVNSFAGLEGLSVVGRAKNDVFTVGALPDFASMPGAVTFNGGDGNDTLVGPDSVNTWNITGKNAGSLDTGAGTVSFTNTENLTGGNEEDDFDFISTTVGKKSTSGSLTGRADAGINPLADMLDYSAYASPVTINFQSKSATALGSFVGIGKFVGSPQPDKFIGGNQPNVWLIGGQNSGLYLNNVVGPIPETGATAGYRLVRFENLTGGTQSDVFQVYGDGAVSGVVNGGGGSDTLLTADLENTWSIQSKNAGQVTQSRDPSLPTSFKFSNIENLTGGTDDDTFQFADGAVVTGKIVGGGGDNTLDYSLYKTAVNVNLLTGAATGVFGGAAGGVSDIDIVLGGNAGDTLTGGTGGSGSSVRNLLIGGPGADKLIGGRDEDLLISGTITFSATPGALDALFAYWTGSDDFATRVANLRAGNIAGIPALNSTTVLSDTAKDTITGGSGLDWYFANLTGPAKQIDTITDLYTAAGEVVN